MQTQAHIWQGNLKALERVDPALAARLASLPIPPHVLPASGRDGAATWRIRRPDGGVEWFGRTSMPTISAEGLLGQFAAGTGNVALAGIGCGLEAKLLSERLGRHRATLVLETDALNAALALRLWPVGDALANRQIVVLAGEDLAALRVELLRFCESHIGFDLPTKMLAWPWRTKSQNAAYQGLIEEVACEVHKSRGAKAAAMLEQLRGRPAQPAVDGVAAVTATPGIVAGRLTQWLAEGAAAAGLASACCWPDSPLHAGPIAGLHAAAQLAGEGRNVRVILLDQFRAGSGLQGVQEPVVTWLTRPEPMPDGWPEALGPSDWLVTATRRQAAQAEAVAGLAARSLHVPAFVSPKVFQIPDTDRSRDVVLLSDLPPEDPEQAGIHLYSHKTLWQVLRKKLQDHADAWTPQGAQRWLLAAQEQTGIELTEPAVQEQFLEVIRACLAPAAVMAHAAQAILQAAPTTRIYGRGWERVNWAKPVWGGPADDPQERIEHLRRAKVAVLGSCRPGGAWLAVEAAATGAAIISLNVWPDADPAELFEPGREMVSSTGRQDLLERLRDLLRNETARAEMAERARRRAREQYAADAQLKGLLQAMAGA